MYDDLARAARPSGLERLVLNAVIPSVLLTLVLHSQHAIPAARICYDCSATLPLFLPPVGRGCFAPSRVPDVFPVLIRMPRPTYAAITHGNGSKGRVLLRAIVNARGRVDSTSIVVMEAADQALVAPALHALAQARFRPAQYDGHAGAAWIMIGIDFKLERR